MMKKSIKKKDQKLKILLVQTSNGNLGDSVIGDNDEYLIRKALGKRPADIFRYNLNSEDVFQAAYADAVIFAGGILKTQTEYFYRRLPQMIEAADRYNVPVFLCAIGAEPYEQDDERVQDMITAVNLPCVKEISIRDDIETFRRQYLQNPEITVSEVIDPAVWSAKTYESYLQRKAKGRGSVKSIPMIGLGIARKNLLEDYGNLNITVEDQLRFWKETVSLLESNHLSWKIFTNGLPEDEAFASEVLAYIGHGEKEEVPCESKDLVRMISGFQGVIAQRMHSNIISYALGIPSIGFIWNRKLAFWGARIHHEERFLPADQMNAEAAVSALLKALSEKKAQSTSRQKKLVYQPVKRFVKNWCVPGVRKSDQIDMKKILTAPHLGCIDHRWLNTNSPEAFRQSIENGYVNFQLDLRLTAEEEMVCVNRWHKDTFRMLQLPADPEKAGQKPLSSDVFLSSRYYCRYSTMTFLQFAKLLQEYIAVRKTIILAVGRPDKTTLLSMLQQLRTCFDRFAFPNDHFILRLERWRDVELCLEQKLNAELMFYQTKEDDDPEKMKTICRNNLEKCVNHNVSWFHLSASILDHELVNMINQYPVRFSADVGGRTDQLLDLFEHNAVLVESRYYSPDYLQKLICDTD